MNYKNKKSRKKLFIILLASVIAICLVLFTLEKLHVINLYTKSPDKAGEQSEGSINYGPPTDDEKNAADTQKTKNQEKEEQRNDSEKQSNTGASVIITDAGQYDNVIEVRAFMPDHYEDGICTIVFTQNSQTISKETPAYRDASTTICTNPLIKRSEFPTAGKWQVIVKYKSPGASGQSDQQTLTID